VLTLLNLSTISSRQSRLSTIFKLSGTETTSAVAEDDDDDDDDADDDEEEDVGSGCGDDVTDERFPRC